MTTGILPFTGIEPMEIYKNILENKIDFLII
jgi:hypothetical protein